MSQPSRLNALHELVAAIDRRVPCRERAAEEIIASDAADLRLRAVSEIAACTNESSEEGLP